MSNRLEVKLEPAVLRWARERSRHQLEDLARKIGVKPERLDSWETSGSISMVQVGKLAHYTHTPLDSLFLPEPQEDRLPISDFRTLRDEPLRAPSPDLLETVLTMERRQSWMRDELIADGHEPLTLVSAYNLHASHNEVAHAMSRLLGLERGWAATQPNLDSALRFLRERVEQAGVLVVFNGIVGNDTHRRLDPKEFRGFALVDNYAPLVFINSADTKGAQMFTLAHEMAHLFIGEGGVSDVEVYEPRHVTEQFCNRIAAEMLVPSDEMRAFWPTASRTDDPYRLVAGRFKVSPIVAARAALDLELITRDRFFAFYRDYDQQDPLPRPPQPSGGDFWNNQNVRIGKRFGSAVTRAVREGRLLYRDAYALTGLKGKTFDRFMEKAGMAQ